MKTDDKGKKATIYDIAEKLGVSATTVSRVINNKGYIADETRERVMKMAAELQYSPNHIARSLKSSRTHQIMLAVPFVKEIFNFDLIDAVQSTVKNNGYSLLLSYTEGKEKEELRIIDDLMKNYADGLILTTNNISDKHLKKLSSAHKPVVLSCFSNNLIEGTTDNYTFDYIGVDTRKGIYMSTKHLIDQGHTKIGYIGPALGNQLGDDRYNGFCLAMNEAGIEINKRLVFTKDHSELFGYEAGLGISSLKELPTAICAATDLIVLGLYRAFEQKGIKVPEDISVIGMDNIDLCTLVKPKISSVAISQAEIGRTAAEIIFERLQGSADLKKNIVFQPRLVVRESSINKKVYG